ncbi:hypothetical protein SAMN05216167_105301 [Spirosoma endophyticum]|uniref:Uncharacterized protein n=1 Tax=Spirosoma endophyticum TaxID=662367 RepID=A0A1I1T0G3_9BACT|nr:hypothetical protein SAMN05216167_105301 [Spirosoma endophyticum]
MCEVIWMKFSERSKLVESFQQIYSVRFGSSGKTDSGVTG